MTSSRLHITSMLRAAVATHQQTAVASRKSQARRMFQRLIVGELQECESSTHAQHDREWRKEGGRNGRKEERKEGRKEDVRSFVVNRRFEINNKQTNERTNEGTNEQTTNEQTVEFTETCKNSKPKPLKIEILDPLKKENPKVPLKMKLKTSKNEKRPKTKISPSPTLTAWPYECGPHYLSTTTTSVIFHTT